MAKVQPGRFTAEVDGDVVVFIIGMRVNRPWKVRRWWPVFVAMPKMLAHLQRHPERGLLGYQQAFFPSPIIVQYWRSFEDLQRFARDADDPHLEPWRRYNREIGKSGDVGVWHETYVVSPGRFEAVYANMPVVGLAAATSHVPVGRRSDAAADRLALVSTQ
jgi:hypothetical protein